MEKEMILKLKEEQEEKLAKILKEREAIIDAKVAEYRASLEADESVEILEIKKIIAGLDELLCPPEIEAIEGKAEPAVEANVDLTAVEPEVVIPEHVEEPIEPEKIDCEAEIPSEEQTSEEIPCEAEAPIEETRPVAEEDPVKEEAPEDISIATAIDTGETLVKSNEVKPAARNLFDSFKISRK